jgi:ABC-type phosphate transport system auxiliary subunit
MPKYVTKKELNEALKLLEKLAKQVNDIARWQAFYAVRENIENLSLEDREKILEMSKGHITYLLFENLFKKE